MLVLSLICDKERKGRQEAFYKWRIPLVPPSNPPPPTKKTPTFALKRTNMKALILV